VRSVRVSRCEERGLLEERVFLRAKRLAGLFHLSRKAGTKDGVPTASKQRGRNGRLWVILGLASESAWRPKDSRKPSGHLACFSVKRHRCDGSMAPHPRSCRYRLPSRLLGVHRFVYVRSALRRELAAHNRAHTPGSPAKEKAQ